MYRKHRRVAAYISLDAVEANFAAMKKNLKEETQIAATIKTDGYGHGAVPIAKLMEPKDYLWGFAVATIEEARELRRNGIEKPILILGYVFPEDYPELVREDVRPAVFRLDMAEELSREAVRQQKTVRIHIKLDTGMSRIGFADNEESVAAIRQIQALSGVEMEGLFTHFSRADEADKTTTKNQLNRYLAFEKKCRAAGIAFPISHCSNSAGIMDMPEANLNMVRAGIIIYGLYPSHEMDPKLLPLEPVMELKSTIVHVKEVKAGTPVSYGGTYVAPSRRRIATVPVGYGDGYPRSLSGKGCVLVAGKRAPILGRVCMDQFMVDVTDIPEAEVGCEVTLFGRDGESFLSLEEISALSGRFNYEFVCDITKRVPRLYVKDGRIVEALDWF